MGINSFLSEKSIKSWQKIVVDMQRVRKHVFQCSKAYKLAIPKMMMSGLGTSAKKVPKLRNEPNH
jgi:hypothetical protein